MIKQEEISRIICVECGAAVPIRDATGSYKHPYCKPCYKKVWRDNDEAYCRWLGAEHI